MPGFQTIGGIAILNAEMSPASAKAKAADILARFSYIQSVYRYTARVSGDARLPWVTYVAGKKDPVATHRENGCFYRLDVTKVMFSKGNSLERGRLPKLVNPGEAIADMFAGIGYFSIPLGKSPAKRIYAIELNPASFRYLKENIRLNKVQEKVEPILGDCRKVKLPEKADRIVMGYLPRTHEYLPAAFRLLKPNGIIHYHDIFRRDELWEKSEAILRERSEKAGFYPIRMEKRVVKQFSPGIFHVVIDAEFRRTHPQVSRKSRD